jgi:glutamate synthase (NADPH/NADH) small chain
MDKKTLQAEALRCLDCKHKPCVYACPAQNDIPNFMKLVKNGAWEEARTLWHKTSNLPELCGALCQNENMCEGACTLNKIHKPVKIGFIESGIAELFKNYVDYPSKKINKKHLVIGLGPAGIANALKMAEFGYQVEAIDANESLGGTVYNLVPEFRFDKKILKDIIHKFEAVQIKTRYHTYVGKDLFLQDLVLQYDSIFIADGLGLPANVDIHIEGLNVYYAQDLLNRTLYNSNDLRTMLGQRIYIIGLGNVAIDMARTLKRIGKDVHIIYRRTIIDAPAAKSEIEAAVQEGVIIHELMGPIAFQLRNKQKYLDCEKTCLIKSEDGGRDLVENLPGIESSFCVDDLIFATGQKTSDILFHDTGIKLLPNISPYSTSLPHVFVGGDRINKNKRIVDAMVTGLEVAKFIAERTT